MFDWLNQIFQSQSSRRQEVAAQPFPEDWQKLIRENVPLIRRMPEEKQQELEQRVAVFLDEKSFEACGGLEAITNEIRVTIAAQACLLTLGKEEFYDRLKSILVYPSSYLAKKEGHGQHRLGESWTTGSVVLAWDSVQHGACDIDDGHNLVLHEFAHQLDQADGIGDGAPKLEQRSHYVSWAKVFGEAYGKFHARIEKGQKTVIDDYGATNPAEFFAVVTETFIEKPKQLHRRYPELYDELKQYYGLDPKAW